MSNNWNGGSTAAWRRIRAAVLRVNQEANRGRCTVAIPGTCTGQATCVHHVKGRGVTGDDPRYLAAACAPCNLKIGDPTRNVALPKEKSVSSW